MPSSAGSLCAARRSSGYNDPRRRCHDRAIDRRCRRRLWPLRCAGPAGLISRSKPARAPVRQSDCQPWADHQARPRARARDAGRTSVGRGPHLGAAARVERIRASRGCRSPWSPPRASSRCCAGTWSSKGGDYAFRRPSLTQKKLRALELRWESSSSRDTFISLKTSVESTLPSLPGVEERSVLFRRLAAHRRLELSRLLNSVGGRQAAR